MFIRSILLIGLMLGLSSCGFYAANIHYYGEDFRPPPIKVYINDSVVQEGERAVFTIYLSEIAKSDSVIHYQIDQGTAIEGINYELSPGEVVIPAGSVVGAFAVSTLEDGNHAAELLAQVQIQMRLDGQPDQATSSVLKILGMQNP